MLFTIILLSVFYRSKFVGSGRAKLNSMFLVDREGRVVWELENTAPSLSTTGTELKKLRARIKCFRL